MPRQVVYLPRQATGVVPSNLPMPLPFRIFAHLTTYKRMGGKTQTVTLDLAVIRLRALSVSTRRDDIIP